MPILAILTSGPWASFAWTQDKNKIHGNRSPNKNQHLAFLSQNLATLPFRPTEIITTEGPGSFTGIRTGLSLAFGLAQSYSAQLKTCSDFDLLKWKITNLGLNPTQDLVIPARKGFIHLQTGNNPPEVKEQSSITSPNTAHMHEELQAEDLIRAYQAGIKFLSNNDLHASYGEAPRINLKKF